MNVEVLNKKDTVHTEYPLTCEFIELIQESILISTSVFSCTIHVKLKS
jgi:hypothetical protein